MHAYAQPSRTRPSTLRLATRALFEEESEIGAGEAAADLFPLLLKAKPFEFGPPTETRGSKN